MTSQEIRDLAARIAAYWATPEGARVAQTANEPFRAAVDAVLGDEWEENEGAQPVSDPNPDWDYGPCAYGCLINAVEQL